MRRGFTILELSLVLATVLVVAAIAIPSLDSFQDEMRVNAAADTVRGCWADARARSLEDGISYRFSVIPQSGKYRLAPDDDSGAAAGDSQSTPLELEDELPSGVVFSNAAESGDNSGGDWTTVAVFLPDGTARNDVEVMFRSGGARGLTLKLRALTGAVTVARDTIGN